MLPFFEENFSLLDTYHIQSLQDCPSVYIRRFKYIVKIYTCKYIGTINIYLLFLDKILNVLTLTVYGHFRIVLKRLYVDSQNNESVFVEVKKR